MERRANFRSIKFQTARHVTLAAAIPLYPTHPQRRIWMGTQNGLVAGPPAKFYYHHGEFLSSTGAVISWPHSV